MYIKKALDEGYTIVHQGLLCWISIPTASLQPKLRLLFLALEATFAYVFWAMRTVTKDYGMAHICLWDRDTLEYDGCCSHCSLNEGIRADFELSTEQLEAQAFQKKEIRTGKQADRNSNYHHRQMETNHAEYLEENLARVVKYQAKDPEKIRNMARDNRANHRVNKTYSCELCKTACQSKSDLDIHLETRSHKKRANDLATKPHKCLPGNYGTDKLSNMNDHLKSKRHLKNVAALSSSQLD
jgi:hypothetical protein